jgi:hypothetical protein
MTDVPNEDEYFDELEYLRRLANASKNMAEVNESMRRRAVNMLSREDLMSHMLTAHDMHPLSLQFYDESEHDKVPLLKNRKRDWSGPTVPSLDHEDLLNWHTYDHTEGEFVDDYPHTTLGNEHFHHD